MTKHQVLFCPFCRESFEGQRSCPEHELLLVPFDKLPPDPLEESARPTLDRDSPLSTFDPRFGRAWVAAGALLTGLSLLLDLASVADRRLSTLTVAASLPSLWTLGLVTFTLLFVLRRRRTLRRMRGLRVLVPALAVLAPLTMWWALRKLQQGAVPWLTHAHHDQVVAGSALYAVLLGAVLVAFGGLRLGVVAEAKTPARGRRSS